MGELWTAQHVVEKEKEDSTMSVRVANPGAGDPQREEKVRRKWARKDMDLAALEVEWSAGIDTEVFTIGPPDGSPMPIGTEVLIVGYPNMINRSGEPEETRLRGIKTWIQCMFKENETGFCELPEPAFDCLSGSPVLYHDWGCSNGLDHVVGMVLESRKFATLDPHDKTGNTTIVEAHWTKAVKIGKA